MSGTFINWRKGVSSIIEGSESCSVEQGHTFRSMDWKGKTY